MIPDPDPADPSALAIQWIVATEGYEAPQLELYMPAISDLTVELEFRVSFDGADVTWAAGPWTPSALDVVVVPIAVPAIALWDAEQELRLSSLSVTVSAWSGATLALVQSAPPMRIAFPDGTDHPVLLDNAAMEALAPQGVLVYEPGAELLGDWETIEQPEE